MLYEVITVTMAVLIYGISCILIVVPEISCLTVRRKTGTAEQLCSDKECENLMELINKRLMMTEIQFKD